MKYVLNKKIELIFSSVLGMIFAIMVLSLLVSSRDFIRDPAPGGAMGATLIDSVLVTVEGESTEMTLPANIRGYEAGTEVKVDFDVDPAWGDTLFVKSVYSSMGVSINGKVVYLYGSEDAYPDFMADPPITSKFIPLADLKEKGHVTLTYEMPVSKPDLELKASLVSNSSGILKFLFKRNLSSLMLSAFLIVAVFVLMLLFLSVVFIERDGIIFLRLAAFCALTCIWNIGDCEVSVFIFKNPLLLYLMTFMGVTAASIPLHNVVLQILNIHNREVIIAARRIMSVWLILAVALQLSGLVMLSRSVYFYMILIILDLFLLLGVSLYEYYKFDDRFGKPMSVALGILIVSAMAESYNFGFRLNTNMPVFLEGGIALFICIMTLLSGNFYVDALKTRKMEEKQKMEVTLMKMRLEHEKKHAEVVRENENNLRRQRHDYRHHLAVLKSLNEANDREALTKYLDEMIEDTTAYGGENYCDNRAVDAVVSGYAARAKSIGVEYELLLEVPDHTSHINDTELCELFGNLLENAVEACGRMTEGRRFITMKSKLHFETLIITMDNSYSGEVRMRGGEYMSSKGNRAGIGMKSIQNVVEKNEGKFKFSAENGIFHSSILLHI